MTKISKDSRFGRLVVLSRDQTKNPLKQSTWLCRCDCGTVKAISYEGLRSGKTNSCGCLRKETTARRSTTHGLRKSSEFNSWASMRARWKRPSDKFYKYYGGRGIKV